MKTVLVSNDTITRRTKEISDNIKQLTTARVKMTDGLLQEVKVMC